MSFLFEFNFSWTDFLFTAFPPPDQDVAPVRPSEAERRGRAPEPLLPQGGLPFAGVRARRGAARAAGAGAPRPTRPLPEILQGGLRGLDVGRADAFLALW